MVSKVEQLCKDLLIKIIADSVRDKLSLSETVDKKFTEYRPILRDIWEQADPSDRIPFTIVEMLVSWRFIYGEDEDRMAEENISENDFYKV